MSPSIISYIIRSGLCLALLYLFFVLFLSRERMHKFNRFYLLFSLVFSLVIPLLTFPVFIQVTPVISSLTTSDSNGSFTLLETLSVDQKSQSVTQWFIPATYLLICAILMLRFIFNIIRLVRSNTINPTLIFKGYKIVLINDPVLPYSFLSKIYLNSDEFRKGLIPDELISHEISHIDQHHSIDIVFIELLKIFFWFNPFIFLFKKEIMLNHEYLADEAVTKHNISSGSYIDLLLNITFRNNNSYLASSFNYSFTKKRLLMITKHSFSKTALLRKLAVIPLVLILGLFMVNAQESKPVAPNAPPPPPPPPPFGYNMWWNPILEKLNITPDPSKSYSSETIYETGDQFSMKDSIVTMQDLHIVIKSGPNFYRTITAKSAIHDINKRTLVLKNAKIDTYRQDADVAVLVDSEWYIDAKFRFDDNNYIAPPPPPPPGSPDLKDYQEKFKVTQ